MSRWVEYASATSSSGSRSSSGSLFQSTTSVPPSSVACTSTTPFTSRLRPPAPGGREREGERRARCAPGGRGRYARAGREPATPLDHPAQVGHVLGPGGSPWRSISVATSSAEGTRGPRKSSARAARARASRAGAPAGPARRDSARGRLGRSTGAKPKGPLEVEAIAAAAVGLEAGVAQAADRQGPRRGRRSELELGCSKPAASRPGGDVGPGRARGRARAAARRWSAAWQRVQRTRTSRPSRSSTCSPVAPSRGSPGQKPRQIQRIGSLSSAGSDAASRDRWRRSGSGAAAPGCRPRRRSVAPLPRPPLRCSALIRSSRSLSTAPPPSRASRSPTLPSSEIRSAPSSSRPSLPRSARQTTGNSRPFARWTVISRTASSASRLERRLALAGLDHVALGDAVDEAAQVAALVGLVLARQAHQLADVGHPPRARRAARADAGRTRSA